MRTSGDQVEGMEQVRAKVVEQLQTVHALKTSRAAWRPGTRPVCRWSPSTAVWPDG